ncbi:MAG: LamG domain-containing protein [Solirubrobacteraceae bacterium]
MRVVRWIAASASALTLVGAASARANVLPVGQWDLNEGMGTIAHNDSPFSGDGALQGSVSWGGGRFQGGLTFDGGTGAVDVPDSPALEGSTVTVSAWVRAAGSPGNFKYIVAKGGNGCCTGSYGLYTGPAGGLEFYVATSTTAYVQSPDAGSGVWDGQWHNVVGTFNGSTVSLYIDGRQVGSGTADSQPIQYGLPSSNDLLIGDYPSCPGLDFTGSIDEVKVFNRALSREEIGLGYLLSRALPADAPFDLIL